jgi:hypothetical protein
VACGKLSLDQKREEETGVYDEAKVSRNTSLILPGRVE